MPNCRPYEILNNFLRQTSPFTPFNQYRFWQFLTTQITLSDLKQKLDIILSDFHNISTKVQTSYLFEVINSTSGNGCGELTLNGARKRPTGPLLLPSPQLAASIPRTPSMNFKKQHSQRRSSLAAPRSPGKMLEPTKSSINLG